MGESDQNSLLPEELIAAAEAVLVPGAAEKDAEKEEKISAIARNKAPEPPPIPTIPEDTRRALRDSLLALAQEILNANQEVGYQQSDNSSIRRLLRDDDFFLQALYARDSAEYATLQSSAEIRKKVKTFRTLLLGWMNEQNVARSEAPSSNNAIKELIKNLTAGSAKKTKRSIWPKKLAEVVTNETFSPGWLTEQQVTKPAAPSAGGDAEQSVAPPAEPGSENKPELTLPEKQAQDLRVIFMHLKKFCEQNPDGAASPEGMLLDEFLTQALPGAGDLLTFTNPEIIFRLLVQRKVISVSRKQIDNEPIEIVRVDLSVLEQQLKKLEDE